MLTPPARCRPPTDWRVEPSVKFFCDISYDPFLAMMDKGAVYGFTLSLFEYVETVPTLWEETKRFLASRPDLAPLLEGNAMKFLSDDGGETYNLVSPPACRPPHRRAHLPTDATPASPLAVPLLVQLRDRVARLLAQRALPGLL